MTHTADEPQTMRRSQKQPRVSALRKDQDRSMSNTDKAAVNQRPPSPPVGLRPGTKAARMLGLLSRPKGASLKELGKATGWQPHSIRGFLSAIVARKMGLKVNSFKPETGDRRYSVKL
jgi:hypothetical protein